MEIPHVPADIVIEGFKYDVPQESIRRAFIFGWDFKTVNYSNPVLRHANAVGKRMSSLDLQARKEESEVDGNTKT